MAKPNAEKVPFGRPVARLKALGTTVQVPIFTNFNVFSPLSPAAEKWRGILVAISIYCRRRSSFVPLGSIN